MPADDPSEQQPIPECFEYFRIRKVLGEGGMGTVYLADDTRLGRQVALKTLRGDLAANPGARDRFLREARSAASLEHDHIIPIYYVGEANGIPFLAMPLLQGEPLNRRLQRAGGEDSTCSTLAAGAAGAATPLPIPEAMRIARQIAAGLALAHGKGLIHRDVKPANVWLEAPSGRVKILDFGLARHQHEDTHLTATGAIVGTPSYVAPEQARGLLIDQRADLFSLGCVLYEMLTGRRPFTGPNTLAILTSLAIDVPRSPHEINPACPPALSRLTMQLLAKEPEQRPDSAGSVADALASMEASTADVTAGVAGGKTAGQGVRRRRVLVLAAISLLALAPLGWWLATVILRLETPNGTLIVKIDDAEVEARIKNGKLILTDTDGKTRYVLSPSDRNRKIDVGEYQIHVEGVDGLVLDTPEFTLKKGDKVTVHVTMVRKAADMQAWLKRVAGLPAEKQVEEFKTKMKELNPGFEGKAVTHKAEHGVVTEIKVVTDKVTNIAPIQVFNALRSLDCGGTHTPDWRGNGQLADLTPLKGMNLAGLTHLNLNFTKVGDAGLAHFADCKNLTLLSLWYTQVGDAGLAHFKGCKNLTLLNLGGTKVSDAGLAHFEDCKNLTHLWLNGTKVGDAGVAQFKDLKSLTSLNLNGTKVSDAGLAQFEDNKNMTWLDLSWTQVSDAGLAQFKDHKNLRVLALSGTKVSDTDLAHFSGCKSLTGLWLDDTQVGDKGLAHFKDCKNLTNLGLSNTQVTDLSPLKGMSLKELRCDFCPDRDTEILRAIKTLETINEKPAAEFWKQVDARKAALEAWLKRVAALSAEKQVEEFRAKMKERNPGFDGEVKHKIEGKVVTVIRFVTDKVTDVAPIRVFNGLRVLECIGTHTNYRSNGQLADLTPLKGMNLAGLTHLNLSFTKVRDAGLAHFADCKNLTFLRLEGTKVSDAGLAQFSDRKNLTYLNLNNTKKVSDVGLAHFKGCKDLAYLDLAVTQVSDEGLAHFKNCKNLTNLNLSWTQVGDEGLAHFKDCKNLTVLYLDETKVSDSGLAYFKDCKNLTVLRLGGTQVGDAGLAHFEDCKNLTSLNLKQTRVTRAKIEELRKALPKCKIEWDGGVIEPKAKE